MVMLPSSMQPTVEELTCPGKKGRTLQYTLILPTDNKHKTKIKANHFIILLSVPNLSLVGSKTDPIYSFISL